mgnify:CR=1 FL=1
MYAKYQELLKNVKGISLFKQDLRHTVPWFIDVLAEKRDDLQIFLKNNNIGSRPMYPPIHQQKAYAVSGNHPVSESIGVNGLWLPSQVQLTDHEIEEICACIRKFYAP